jgi:histidinol-phosphate aminotransferase
MNVKKLVRKGVKKAECIKWGETKKDWLVLKWGENFYPPCETVVRAITKTAKESNLYPDPLKSELVGALSKYARVPSKNILVTNGLDKAFRLIAETFIEKGDNAITCAPSYPVFDSAVEIFGGIVKYANLSSQYLADIEKIIGLMDKRTKLIYLCNPNNPTSNIIVTKKGIVRLLKTGAIVILDEAYYEFSKITYSNLLKRYENLLVLRSFSKGIGLAGLRVGYVLASEIVIKEMKKIEDTIEVFNVPATSLAGAVAALKNKQYFLGNLAKMEQTKSVFCEGLKKINLPCVESKTSFVLFSLEKVGLSGKEFVKRMSRKRILLKDCSIYKNMGKCMVYAAIPPAKKVKFVLKSIEGALA